VIIILGVFLVTVVYLLLMHDPGDDAEGRHVIDPRNTLHMAEEFNGIESKT
jgi:hypothetical protein